MTLRREDRSKARAAPLAEQAGYFNLQEGIFLPASARYVDLILKAPAPLLLAHGSFCRRAVDKRPTNVKTIGADFVKFVTIPGRG